MSFEGMLVTEVFESLQGETSLSGVPFTFIRLTGCNLRCVYCDSTYAFKGGKQMEIQSLVTQCQEYGHKNVLITGGEPLMQRNTPALIDELNKKGFLVSIETHGEVSIESVANRCRIVMDIKTPDSGMNRGAFRKNLQHLKETDEVKFVICSKQDYVWAKDILKTESIPSKTILFSPVVKEDSKHEMNYPGEFSPMSVAWLAENIVKDKLDARLQVQLHKVIWPDKSAGY